MLLELLLASQNPSRVKILRNRPYIEYIVAYGFKEQMLSELKTRILVFTVLPDSQVYTELLIKQSQDYAEIPIEQSQDDTEFSMGQSQDDTEFAMGQSQDETELSTGQSQDDTGFSLD